MFFGLLTPTSFRGAPRDEHLSTWRECQRTHLNGPIRFPQNLSVSTITEGNARVGGRSTFPALTLAWLCILSRLRAEEYDRLVTQSIANPGAVFEDDDPHPRSDAGRPLEPWVCHHTREPTVLSRVSCRQFHLNIDRFHQPCLLPGRTSRIGEDCRPRTTWRPLTLFGQPGSSSFACHWRFLLRRLDGTTAGC